MRHVRVSDPQPRLGSVSPSEKTTVANATGTTDGGTAAERPKLLLIDGHSMAYRAFFALPAENFRTKTGQVTNAVFGFTSMLINLMKDHRPDGVLVAFDRPEPTFRHERHVEYKATREAAPDILRQQMGLVRQVLDALRMTVLELPGFEALDRCRTVLGRIEEHGIELHVGGGMKFRIPDDLDVVVRHARG